MVLVTERKVDRRYGASLAGGFIGEGVDDLPGGVTAELLTSDILDIDELWDKAISRVNDEILFGASTGLLEHGHGECNGIIEEEHVYAIMKTRTLASGQRLVKLRNGWGSLRKGIWESTWSDGSKEWTAELPEKMDHKFGSDSAFWISYEDLVQKYSYFYPYHEKFHIKLMQDSPLFLTLAQLDEKYFKGLEAQESFRLHFQLHYEGSPNGEDYIVRSHSNYLLHPSVSVELPALQAENYVIWLKIAAQRYIDHQSVEAGVKRQAADRMENEKLGQVAYAYDLAHSKAWDHMDKKNLEKRKRRRAYWEAEWARLDEQLNAKIKAEREQMKKERLAKVEADKAADEALGRKAEEIKMSEDKDEPVVIDEHHKYHDDAAISASTGSPHLSPKSIDSTAETNEKQQVPPVSGGPPPTPPTHIEEDPLPIHPRPAYDSVAECTPRTRTLSYAPSWKAVSF
ncbi:Calpain-type cysteine protease ADL1 [Fusarium oxysporum f. sp. conglutinans]|nr:Calpain-type cysteine protease ADL1 [Fusarium oxysporum f. sp. conglutinans]